MKLKRFLKALMIIVFIFALLHKPFMARFCPLKYQEEIWILAKENEINPYLIASLIKVESNYRKEAVSPKGAVGLMQLMPSTAAWLAEVKGIKLTADSLYDPVINISLGSYYLKTLVNDLGKISAIAAYNAGRGNVERWINEETWDGSWEKRADIPFYETRDFVIKVVILEKWYNYLYNNQLSRELVVWKKSLKEKK